MGGETCIPWDMCAGKGKHASCNNTSEFLILLLLLISKAHEGYKANAQNKILPHKSIQKPPN